ncbi:accessory Sec system protein Asp1 [Ligilactobacillus equi]|uniref:Accessory secretory protein Asp1 n=2 Tax=Ligilactobacillus equi TaxID=137357 RepID=V7HT74_9LACO|nr:accessory Sec system protein Asp1 [Ligilactobacillus equi]ETA73394.1 accessory secretory protein Asp1 [Ligilactobacillus equi DPC 6820]MCQ2556749.1 accessory Sec system protein Asp1 [Ligilactobacillus sp.]
MYYFIPSWYKEQKSFSDNEKPWYFGQSKMEFDDTINQVRMFAESQEKVKLIILNYFPKLRHFLHRQDIYEIEYFNLFDWFQGFDSRTPYRYVSLSDLVWPKQAELEYTMFEGKVYVNQKLYARVEYTPEGSISLVRYFSDDQLQKEYILDDRGFLSSIIYYQAGQAQERVYVDIAGRWRLKENLINQTVTVNQKLLPDLAAIYPNLAALIEAGLGLYLQQLRATDILVIAANQIHNNLILNNAIPTKKVLSFFRDRQPYADEQGLQMLLGQVDLAIVDTYAAQKRLEEIEKPMSQAAKIYQMPPFDSRLNLGVSQRNVEEVVYMTLDGLPDIQRKKMLKQAFLTNEEIPNMKLILVSGHKEWLGGYQSIIDQVLAEINLAEVYCNQEQVDKSDHALIELNEEEETSKERFAKQKFYQLVGYGSEQEIITAVSKARLVVDLRQIPNTFLQIAGISAGIPQLNLGVSDYLVNEQNGLLLDSLDDLNRGLHYYLDGLQNWNKAMVYAVNQISEYTSGKIVERWQKLIGGELNGTSD